MCSIKWALAHQNPMSQYTAQLSLRCVFVDKHDVTQQLFKIYTIMLIIQNHIHIFILIYLVCPFHISYLLILLLLLLYLFANDSYSSAISIPPTAISEE